MRLKSLVLGALIAHYQFPLLYAPRRLPPYAKDTKCDSSFISMHNAGPCFRDDGTYVQGHRSVYSSSGVHCHNNVYS